MATRKGVAKVESSAVRRELDRMVAELRSLHAEMKAHREKYDAAFSEMEEMAAEEAALSEQLKVLVRQVSEPDKTVVVLDDPDLLISVQGRMSPREYSLEKAEECWPEEVIDLCLVAKIDSKKVEGLLNKGLITDKVAEAALLPRVPATPAVTIKAR